MINDIAKELGVSKTTISRAISGNGRVSEKTRKRILKYTAEIGYIPNAAARNLATTKAKNIAFSMPLNRDSIRSDYFLECLFGVNKKAIEASYDVLILGDEIDTISRVINSRKADGMVLTRNIGDTALEKLALSGIPIVLTGSTSVPNIIQVSYDAKAAFSDLTLRLMDMWEGDFGLIVTRKEFPANQTRVSGFSHAITKKNRTTFIEYNAVTEDDVYRAFHRMNNNGIRNIICGDDAVCLNLLNIIKGGGRFESKFDPGKTGHDNINIASFHSSHYLETFHPEIPVVQLDPEKLGDIACKMLLLSINGYETPVTTLLDYIIRF
ncbi:MAG: LacI family transcriptional regulator [Treponema sp.]|nr:LacI family transcriptional regulator [Treponema sp.]